MILATYGRLQNCNGFLTKIGSKVDHAALGETLWRDIAYMDMLWEEVCHSVSW